jgi:hypothetical protein
MINVHQFNFELVNKNDNFTHGNFQEIPCTTEKDYNQFKEFVDKLRETLATFNQEKYLYCCDEILEKNTVLNRVTKTLKNFDENKLQLYDTETLLQKRETMKKDVSKLHRTKKASAYEEMVDICMYGAKHGQLYENINTIIEQRQSEKIKEGTSNYIESEK